MAVGAHRLSRPAAPVPLRLHASTTHLAANGAAEAELTIEADGGPLPASGVQLTLDGGSRAGRILSLTPDPPRWRAALVAGVQPGRYTLRAQARGFLPATLTIETTPALADADEDGLPDFLALTDARDVNAFRAWFTYLAEATYFTTALPRDVNDCAGLVRFAFREALKAHDSAWANQLGLPLIPTLPAVQRYQYPHTPLQANLFRVRPGPFQPSDLQDGAFAQFADAKTLRLRNTYFVSRDLRRALPGDLLFFEQASQDMPFHVMVYLGPGHFARDAGPWVVYHTGPVGAHPGEVRRLTLDQLLQHPQPRWRPVLGNANFLGIHRWHVLRKDS